MCTILTSGCLQFGEPVVSDFRSCWIESRFQAARISSSGWFRFRAHACSDFELSLFRISSSGELVFRAHAAMDSEVRLIRMSSSACLGFRARLARIRAQTGSDFELRLIRISSSGWLGFQFKSGSDFVLEIWECAKMWFGFRDRFESKIEPDFF